MITRSAKSLAPALRWPPAVALVAPGVALAAPGVALAASGVAPSPSSALAGDGSVSEAIGHDARVELFARAFERSGLGPRLSGDAWTAFVPADAALQREGLAFLLGDVLLSAENAERLELVVAYHVVPGVRVDGAALDDDLTLNTLARRPLTVGRAGGAVRVDGHAVVVGRIESGNGVVYLIDRMLWPERWPR